MENQTALILLSVSLFLAGFGLGMVVCTIIYAWPWLSKGKDSGNSGSNSCDQR